MACRVPDGKHRTDPLGLLDRHCAAGAAIPGSARRPVVEAPQVCDAIDDDTARTRPAERHLESLRNRRTQPSPVACGELVGALLSSRMIALCSRELLKQRPQLAQRPFFIVLAM